MLKQALGIVALGVCLEGSTFAAMRSVMDNYNRQDTGSYTLTAPQTRHYSSPRVKQSAADLEARRAQLKFASQLSVKEKTFIFDPAQGGWAAYDQSGSLIKTGVGSAGANWCASLGRSCRTTVGAFRVYRRGGADCKSSKYPLPNGGGPMPYCMFFHGGMAVHGSYDIPTHNASHGCLRVTPTDAKWLHQNFLNRGTKVIVKPYAA